MNFKELLNEVFDIKPMTKVNLILKKSGIIGNFIYKGNKYIAKVFGNPEKSVELFFEIESISNSLKIDKGKYDLTDFYQQHIILPTAFYILKKYIEKYNPKIISYYINNKKRGSIYNKFMNKLGYKKEDLKFWKLNKTINIMTYIKK